MVLHDVVIVGAGPAGLSAALVLGRCRRDVVVIDSGQPRNGRSKQANGFLTRDGTPPADLRRVARSEVERYGVRIFAGEVTTAKRTSDGVFELTTTLGSPSERAASEVRIMRAHKVLLATGMIDLVPQIDGFDTFYGTSVHHCPYCDGWEHKDQRLVAFGKGDRGVGLALALKGWSDRVTACTEGEPPSDKLRIAAKSAGVTIREERVRCLEGDAGRLARVVLSDGSSIDCDGLFFNTGQSQRSNLPKILGCHFKDDGGVKTSERQCTVIPGLYLAGDADKDVQFIVVAAAEGATAAVAINRELQDERCGLQ